ncbi:uncharacterized protein BKCO1_630005 [Diplodia corticola]|uniref:Integral membrane protein n=1 Tax=Diplodia corticola TaxID=236234 RepID=A0A1J9RQT1_9PEZI|nr:uncharacterized protein BKCO1_630005 [Diplodia corticola]OJD30260.1 integral membrane protein [Diplodia corticola]
MSPENHSYFAIWCYVSYALGTFVVVLRLYTRLFVVTSLGVDDYFVIAATICSTGITACIPFMFNLGIGKHIIHLTVYEVNHGRKWAWYTQIIYYLALGTFPVGCDDLLSFNYFNAAFHILADMVLALLPIPVLKNLQIDPARRRGLVVIFGVTALAVAGTIAR